MFKKILIALGTYSLISMIIGSWMLLFNKWPWNQGSEIVIWWWTFHIMILFLSSVLYAGISERHL